MAISCESCGGMLVTPVERQEIQAELRRIDQERIKQIREMEYFSAIRWAGTSQDRLSQVAMARGYRPGWVRHRLEELGQ
jgi:hypothetical protein